jgi:hypothetical protein
VNKMKNHSKLVAIMVLTITMFAGMSVSTSHQLSYASLFHAEDSDCAIFCPNLEFQLDNSVSQSNNCGNDQVNPNGGDGTVFPSQLGNSTESTDTVNCGNTGPIR